MQNLEYFDIDDPYEFKRIFDNAFEAFAHMGSFNSKWRGIPTDEISAIERSDVREKRLQLYHEFIDPRSIGLFLADHYSDLEGLNSKTDYYFELTQTDIDQHGVSEAQHELSVLCSQKYMPVMVALNSLDRAFEDYFKLMLLKFEDYVHSNGAYQPQAEKRLDIVATTRLAHILDSLEGVTSRFQTLSQELGLFYVMEMQEQQISNLLDVDAHYSVLNAILRSEPLRTTFLSSARNGFGKCPFHAINQVFALDCDVSDEGEVILKDQPRRGALMPFVIDRIGTAIGKAPEVKFVLQLSELEF